MRPMGFWRIPPGAKGGGPGAVFFHRQNLLTEFSDGRDGGTVAHRSAAPRPGFSRKAVAY